MMDLHRRIQITTIFPDYTRLLVLRLLHHLETLDLVLQTPNSMSKLTIIVDDLSKDAAKYKYFQYILGVVHWILSTTDWRPLAVKGAHWVCYWELKMRITKSLVDDWGGYCHVEVTLAILSQLPFSLSLAMNSWYQRGRRSPWRNCARPGWCCGFRRAPTAVCLFLMLMTKLFNCQGWSTKWIPLNSFESILVASSWGPSCTLNHFLNSGF